MSELNKELVRRAIEAMNNRNLDAFDDLFTSDFFGQHIVMQVRGLEQWKDNCRSMWDVFTDSRAVIDEMIAEGDKVMVRVTSTSTHRGAFWGIPGTGRRIESTAILVYRIANGKIAEERRIYDRFGMMQQMGAMPLGDLGSTFGAQPQ